MFRNQDNSDFGRQQPLRRYCSQCGKPIRSRYHNHNNFQRNNEYGGRYRSHRNYHQSNTFDNQRSQIGGSIFILFVLSILLLALWALMSNAGNSSQGLMNEDIYKEPFFISETVDNTGINLEKSIGIDETRDVLDIRDASHTYTVQPGDTIISIAREVQGDASNWIQIVDLNNLTILESGVVLIYPGQELLLTDDGTQYQ